MNQETSQFAEPTDDTAFFTGMTIEEFLEPLDSTSRQSHRYNKHDIPKNQQEFGHKKRIRIPLSSVPSFYIFDVPSFLEMYRKFFLNVTFRTW